jgi:hypothetical protein
MLIPQAREKHLLFLLKIKETDPSLRSLQLRSGTVSKVEPSE